MALGALALALPLLVSTSQLDLVGVILVYAMVGVSLVVLTGWAGQVSLGAVAFLAIGATVGVAWGIDPAAQRLPEETLPAGVVEGASGSGQPGYRGPCPPPGDGPHRYRITV